jgi:rRNA biogenesis protein RRP5
MSSLKRKEGPDGSSKSKRPAESRPSKRSRHSNSKPSSDSKDDGKTAAKKTKDVANPPKSKPNKGDAKPAPAPAVSLLREEEPLFPRGGASVLTPLEHKQIQIEAKNDALFEQEAAASGKKEKVKGKKRKSDAGATTAQSEDDVKIESLNFKVCPLPWPCFITC